MILSSPTRRILLASLAALAIGLPPARALLNIDGSRNQVFVFGSLSFAYSSNIFSDNSGRGDYSSTAEAGIEVKRRAGIIAVNTTFKVSYQGFNKYTTENALNPSFYIEFNKTVGRTTGAFTINAFRETRSDSAVNLRTSSWNFPLGLNIKYPINDKFYVTSSTSYLQKRYSSTTVLTNLTDYSEGVDLFYVYTSKLDLVAGYRLRVSRTTNGNDTTDHWFNFGATGGLFAKLNGTLRFGYQIRDDRTGQQSYSNFDALAALGWPITRKLTLSSQISRDFNTIATGASVDSSSISLRAAYAITRKIEFDLGTAYGRNLFLGRTTPHRRDDFYSWDVGAHYKVNEHLNLSASYTYFRNWSTLSFSDFERQGLSFDIGSRF